MKSNFFAATVVAVAAFTSVAASAETFNSFVFDQMATPSAKTRAEVKAEAVQAPAAANAYSGALNQQTQTAPRTEKTSAPPQAAAELVKTSQQ
jgi:hypothetical protein